jgi:hypothetical protein
MAKSKLSIVATATAEALDFVAMAASIGTNVGKMTKLDNEKNILRVETNKTIIALHKHKVVVGTYRKDGTGCAIATAFVDAAKAAGMTQSTAQQTYLPTFKAHVASGKEVTEWNSQRAKTKGNGGKSKTKKELADKLNTCYRDAEFAEFIADLEKSWDDGEISTLMEGIKSYLEMNGIELKDTE